ncbi:MAG: hypothetical protein HYS13_03270 [Planctomycetia bacterium]|nr:hypothetical protein [Planctomycetia bacterium]
MTIDLAIEPPPPAIVAFFVPLRTLTLRSLVFPVLRESVVAHGTPRRI